MTPLRFEVYICHASEVFTQNLKASLGVIHFMVKA